MKVKRGELSILITGAVTSGKSTLAGKLSKELSIELINEKTSGNYYQIIDKIIPEYYPNAIFEHCWIYKKWFIFKALYKKTILIVISPSDELLLKNFNERLIKNETGDYKKFDPIEQKQMIFAECELIKKDNPSKNFVVKFIDIDESADYEEAYSKIKLAIENLNT